MMGRVSQEGRLMSVQPWSAIVLALGVALTATPQSSLQAQSSLLLEEMTWQEIRAAIEDGIDTVLVTVGATEQHGPQIALSSDSVTGDFLGPEVARRLGRALVAPNIRLGVSAHHMLFPGTITIRQSVLETLLREYVHSLAWHGFRHIVILPTHGGNFTAAGRVATQLAPLYPHLDLAGYADAQSYIDTLQATTRKLKIPLEVAGSHAGLGETAMVMAIRPDLVRPESAEPGFLGDAYGVGDRMTRDGTQAISPIGVLGDPRGATAETGNAYLADLAAHLTAFARRARDAWRPSELTELPYGGLPEPSGPLAEGIRLRRSGRYGEARAFFEQQGTARPASAEPIVELARTFVLEGQPEAARRTLEPLSAWIDPAVQRQAHDELALVALYRGDIDTAIEHKRAVRSVRAREGHPRGEAQALFYIGYIQTEAGAFDAAAATYAEALDLAPEISDTHLDLQHLMGILDVARGHLLQAAARLRPLEDAVLQPAWAAHVRRFYHLQGEILLARGRVDDALQNLAPAIRIYDHPLYRESLARALARAGRLDAAAAEYRHLLGLRDARLDVPLHYVKAHYALAQLYEAQGKTAEAGQMYRAFLAFWGGAPRPLPGVAEAKARLAGGW
jgi:creatinine amidohydrolase